FLKYFIIKKQIEWRSQATGILRNGEHSVAEDVPVKYRCSKVAEAPAIFFRLILCRNLNRDQNDDHNKKSFHIHIPPMDALHFLAVRAVSEVHHFSAWRCG